MSRPLLRRPTAWWSGSKPAWCCPTLTGCCRVRCPIACRRCRSCPAPTRSRAWSLRARWRDGVFAEIAHWPAACVTPLTGLDDKPATELIGLAKLIVPFGGLQRSGLRGGDTIIVNGATGYFGSGAVMLVVAMGAGRVVAAGRNADALESLCTAFGPRVVA